MRTRRSGGMTPAANVFRSYGNSLSAKLGRLQILASVWEQEAGRMAAYWQIDFVRNGEIFVKVKSPAAAQELQLRKNSIIRCINRYFDRPWIISVKAI